MRNAAQYMKGNTEHYIFISTVSAYANDKNTWADESDPTAPMPAGLDPYTLPTDASRRANYGRAQGVLGEGSREALSGDQHDHSARA